MRVCMKSARRKHVSHSVCQSCTSFSNTTGIPSFTHFGTLIHNTFCSCKYNNTLKRLPALNLLTCPPSLPSDPAHSGRPAKKVQYVTNIITVHSSLSYQDVLSEVLYNKEAMPPCLLAITAPLPESLE